MLREHQSSRGLLAKRASSGVDDEAKEARRSYWRRTGSRAQMCRQGRRQSLPPIANCVRPAEEKFTSR
jgi:hypothetical protein